MSERRSATGTLTQRVSSAVDHELQEAAAARWEGAPEVFLWRARRCAEALLYALLHQQKVDVAALAEQGKTLEDLLKHKQLQGALSREMRNHLESLQKYGNTAVHVQLDGSASDGSVAIVASTLAELVTWFFAQEGGGSAAAVAALTSRERRIRSRHELESDRANERFAQLQQRLRDVEGARAPRPSRPSRAPYAALAGGGLAGVLAGALAVFALGRLTAPTGSRVEALEPAPVVEPTSVALPAPAPEVVAPAPEVVAPAPAPTRLSCPASMALVPAEGARAAFCIDREVVLEGEYRRCVNEGGCARPGPAPENGCNWQNAQNGLAANCLSAQLARAYCQRRDGGVFDLPTRAEWSAAAAARAPLRLVPGTSEWSADLDGPELRRVRGAREGAGFAWTSEGEGQGRRHISFRCVMRASP